MKRHRGLYSIVSSDVMRIVCILLLACVMHYVVAVNIYQTCGMFSSAGYWLGFRLDPLVKEPTDSAYSYQLNSTHTILYNFCEGTSACGGAMVCVKGPDGIRTIAYPGDEVQTFQYSSTEIQLSYYPPTNTYVVFQLSCSKSQTSPVEVASAFYSDDELRLSITTPALCMAEYQPAAGPTVKGSKYLSGDIYMKGYMPMWAFDHVSSQNGQNTFEGRFYYSANPPAYKINGTLSNSSGQSSRVGLIVTGERENREPPSSVAVFQPNDHSLSCALLPNPNSAYHLSWFNWTTSSFQVTRPYESIYFEKGTTFNVTEYFFTPYYTLMQRESDQATVALGQYFLMPFTDAYHNTIISEVNWNTLDESTLPPSTFELPASWGCLH